MQFKKTATIVLAATMIVTSFSFNTVSASETAEAVDQVKQIENTESERTAETAQSDFGITHVILDDSNMLDENNQAIVVGYTGDTPEKAELNVKNTKTGENISINSCKISSSGLLFEVSSGLDDYELIDLSIYNNEIATKFDMKKMGFDKDKPDAYLDENEMPKQWYNVRADMKTKPAPLLNPSTLQPMTLEELSGVFCTELAKQELDNETPYFDIPEEICDFYKMYRPSPLVRAYFLEKALDTPAKIYYKFEGNNTSGSHKLNSAIAQAYYAKKQGLKGVTTETGAGQWGTALSMACSYFDLDCKVYMVKVSYEQKPFRREVMRTYGASVTPSPSNTTNVGRKILEQFPGTTGSLGCAISEAVETAVSSEGYRYVLGSVLSQVLLHQSIIGLESMAACDKYDIKPDVIIGCAGGGSNLGGLISPFMGRKLRGEADYKFIAVEPASCPSMTRGKYAYDFCDTGMVCPLSKMYTLGSGFIPSANHAGGLRYHGMSSVVSELYDEGLIEARSVEQTSVFDAATMFARIEGTLPAPESSHAIRVAIDEALKCKETGEEKTILFGLTGTGYFDMVAYQKYNDGAMSDYIPTDKELEDSINKLPKI